MPHDSVPQQVALLKAAFPRETIPPETLGVYVTKLGDIDAALLAAAVNRLIEDSRFFPTIAEIRRMAAKLAGILPPEPAEALAMIHRADRSTPVYRRDGSLACTEREWDWSGLEPKAIEFCQAVLAKAGDPVNLDDGEKHFGWDLGFKQLAEAETEAFTRNLLADLSHARLPAYEPKLLT